MGVIFGAVLVNSLSFTQKEDLFYYLSQFFGQVSQGEIAPTNEMFSQSIYIISNILVSSGFWDFDYWFASHFNFIIFKRNGRWIYGWFFSQSNGLEWIFTFICRYFATKYIYRAGFYHH